MKVNKIQPLRTAIPFGPLAKEPKEGEEDADYNHANLEAGRMEIKAHYRRLRKAIGSAMFDRIFCRNRRAR